MLQGTTPRGTTPLTERLKKIHRRIAPQAMDLARKGQKVVLVIATDGLPTGSGYTRPAGPEQQRLMVAELRRISAELPMHLVVRLCTNVDDVEGEAREIYNNGNRWLVYSPLIHRIREGR